MWLSQHLEPETSSPIPSWININYPPAKNVLSIVICQCPHAPACPLCLSVFSSATAAPSSFLVLLSKPYGGWVASANPGYCFGWRCSYLPAQESVTMPQKEHTTRKVTLVIEGWLWGKTSTCCRMVLLSHLSKSHPDPSGQTAGAAAVGAHSLHRAPASTARINKVLPLIAVVVFKVAADCS